MDDGSETPEETWARLQRLYGSAEGPPPDEIPVAPTARPTEVLAQPGVVDAEPVGVAGGIREAGPPRQYHVAAPETSTSPPDPAPVRPPGPPSRAAVAAGAYAAGAAIASPPRDGAASPPRGPSPPASARAHRRRIPLPRPKLKWLRPKLRWFYLYLPLLIILAVLAAVGWAYWKVDNLYRVDVGSALATPVGSARNYLIVGSDTREGIDPSVDDTGTIGDAKGQRSDTIIVLRTDGPIATMMSIPRDLWVKNPATGKQGRINATYNTGPENLVAAVTGSLGIPIHHYVEVDFETFSRMVDAMGGVTIDFPHPAFDRKSGLKVDQAGPNHLDGSQALAYVRSRAYTEIIDGKPHTDPTADLGRQQRQQTFIRTVLHDVGEIRNPITLARVMGAAASGTRVDRELGIGDLFRLARNLSGADPSTEVLPTVASNKGGASVLELERAKAAPVLAKFGAG